MTDIGLNLNLEHEGKILFVTNERGGMVFRLQQPKHSVTYSDDINTVREVLRLLYAEGRDVLESRARTDSAIDRCWRGLSQVGFFYDAPSSASNNFKYSVTFDEDSDFNDVLRKVTTLETLLGISIHQEVYVQKAAAIPLLHERFSPHLRKHSPNTERSILSVLTPLEGGSEDSRELIPLLDTERIRIRVQYDLGISRTSEAGTEDSFECHRRLEEQGYLFRLFIHLTPNMVTNSESHSEIAREIERILTRSPNQTVDLSIQRPVCFSSEDTIDAYYDSLEDLVTSLYSIDADVSQLSFFGSYFSGVFGDRNGDRPIDMGVENHRLIIGLSGGFGPVQSVEFREGEIEKSLSRLEELASNDPPNGDCIFCPYTRFCQKGFIEPYIASMLSGEERTAESVYRRECRIHRLLFGHLFAEILCLCEERSEKALPVRLEVTEDRQFAITPY